MSETKKENSVPTNEEIVDDLTKDLESQFFISDEERAKCLQDDDSDKAKNIKDSDGIDSDSSEENGALRPDDFIDELELKEIESSLSQKEIEIRQKEAMQLKSEGNSEFKSGNYIESVNIYTKALRLCPLKYTEDRAILYANRAACKIQLERKASALDDCKNAIELNPSYIRAYLRRAKLYEETDKLDESLADYKKILELDPGNKDALSGCHRLPPLIEERNEKLKTEMIGKLKDLGNIILKPFGLSTDNFKLQQNSETGGYSVNFQK